LPEISKMPLTLGLIGFGWGKAGAKGVLGLECWGTGAK